LALEQDTCASGSFSTSGSGLALSRYAPNDGADDTVSENHYHAREAAAALLKMAKAASDPAVAAGLVQAAVTLKDQAGELRQPLSIRAPDVQPEGEPPETV